MIKDNVKATGQVSIQVFDSKGNLKDSAEVKNLVVSVGRAFIAARMVGTPTAMSHMALGSGTSAAVAGNTTLGTELGRAVLGSSTVAGNVVTYSATFPIGVATGAVTEAGLFNAGTAGTQLARVVFPVVNKAAGDTIGVTWNISIN